MKKRSKMLAAVMAAVVAAATVVGCGAQSAATDTADSSAAATADEAAENAGGATTEAAEEAAEGESSSSVGEGTITISMQNNPGAQEGWEAVGAAYEKMHPGVDVVVDLKAADGYDQWLQTLLTSENPQADLVAINLAGATSKGKSINYMEYIDNESPYTNGPWRDQFDVSRQVINMADNSFDGLNLETVQVVWLYNADIFKEAGVEPPTTWDELIAACEKIQAAGYQPIAIDGDYNSFYAQTMGWLAQIYYDQTSRDAVNLTRAQEGDFCYDPDIDGTWSYDPTDPFNDDPDKVSQNIVRAFAAVANGERRGDTEGMKTVWTNFAKVFPQYAGGDAMFGTNFDGAKSLFYQGKAAMMVNIASGIVEHMNNMKTLEAGEQVEAADGSVIENAQKFELGTFNMPSMEGEGIQAKARTIEVSNGCIGSISKDQAHNDLVIDFLMYYSSPEGISTYMDSALANGYVPNGKSLVYNVTYPEEIQSAFDSLTMIGNVQKDFAQMLARGIGESGENYRAFYEYSYDFLTGAIDVDTWAQKHQENIESHLAAAMEEKSIGENDLKNPQNAPAGN